MQIGPRNAAGLKIDFNHLMPSENRSVGVAFSRECAEVDDVIYSIPSGRIDQRFAVHKHVHCIASEQKNPSDVFQCVIESSRIIEIDEARSSKLMCKLFQSRLPSRRYRKVCLPPF